MSSSNEIALTPEYKATMERLEAAKHVSATGVDYWLAREICPILGYTWEGFGNVIDRARKACDGVGIAEPNHFRQTSKMVTLGSDAQRRVDDWFLSRPACYLIAMNGDPAKAEVAAAQAYFAIQTRRMELQDQENEDTRRLEMRERVSTSFRKVSGVAKSAGVRNKNQALFHDARYQGLYGMSYQAVKGRKGLKPEEQLFDRAGALELSANDFQMNLAANVIEREAVKGEQRAIDTNRSVGRRVRSVIEQSRGTMPEDLPLAPPIKEVSKRVAAQKKPPKLPPK